MTASESSTSEKSQSLWEVPNVQGGLQLTGRLLTSVLELGTKSQNHSLKAQHLLSRGIEILVSVQLYLNNGGEDLLKTLQTLNDLEETENVLTTSIGILDDDVNQTDSASCDQAVMSSWHLNRNAFTAELEKLPKPESKTGNERWTTVLKDVVRADDLGFATRLSEDVQKNCENDEAKRAVQIIVDSLETTAGDENTRTDSILGIMCLADQSKRTETTGLGDVVLVVNEMAQELREPGKPKWESISQKLHKLPVCRKVEKPLLLHQGAYTISDIIKDAQTEVLSAGGSIGDSVPLETEDLTGETFVDAAKKHVTQINDAMVEATRNLLNLSKKKSFNDATGEKNQNQILYATMRLLGDTAFALAPVLALSAFTGEVNKVTDSVSGFVKALTEFNGVQDQNRWKGTLTRTLQHTAEKLKAFGEMRTIEEKGLDRAEVPVEDDTPRPSSTSTKLPSAANAGIQTTSDGPKVGGLTDEKDPNDSDKTGTKADDKTDGSTIPVG